jgi:hypothetical protein
MERLTSPLAALLVAGSILASACGDDELVFDLAEVERSFEEVVECRWSHEHELNHVRVLADPTSAAIFRACVLTGEAENCIIDGERVTGFPVGSLFVKYEYDDFGCEDDDFMGYTASLRLADGSFPAGRDWQWQRVSPRMALLEDGAPTRCIGCHIDHCEAPYGLDLRCLPD